MKLHSLDSLNLNNLSLTYNNNKKIDFFKQQQGLLYDKAKPLEVGLALTSKPNYHTIIIIITVGFNTS